MTDITYAMTDEAIMQEIGWRIRQRRIARQLKQSEIANHLGVSLPTYRRVEQGDMKFSLMVAVLRSFNDLETLNSLLPAANVSPMALLNNAVAPKQRVSKNRNAYAGTLNNNAKVLMTQFSSNTGRPQRKTRRKDDEKW